MKTPITGPNYGVPDYRLDEPDDIISKNSCPECGNILRYIGCRGPMGEVWFWRCRRCGWGDEA